jgi:hypothetical protein
VGNFADKGTRELSLRLTTMAEFEFPYFEFGLRD